MRRTIPLLFLLTVPFPLLQCSGEDGPVPIPEAVGPKPKLIAVAMLRSVSEVPQLFDVIRKEVTKGAKDVVGKDLLREEHLPMRVHVFADETAQKFLMDIETAVPLDAQTLSQKIAERPLEPVRGMTDAWTAGGMSLRAMPAGPGRPRLLFGDLFGTEPAANPWFHHLLEAELTKGDERQLAKVKDSFGYALIRGGVIAQANPMTQQFLAFAGPRGLTVAAGASVENGRPVVDYHLGLRVGEGIVGSLLPKDAGDATLLVTPPFQPSVISLIDLGPSVARIAEFGLSMAKATGMPEDFVEALKTVADSATGKLNVFGGEKQTTILLELDDDTEKDIDGVLELLRKLLPGAANQANGLANGQVNGQAAPQTVLVRKGKMLELTMRGEGAPAAPATAWKSPFSAFVAPVKFWLGPEAMRRMEEAQKNVPAQLRGNPAYMRGLEAGQAISRSLFQDRIEMFIRWSTKGTHVRMKL